MKNAYERILNLPRHESKRHPKMTLLNRAAQFAPFAALTGYEESIGEEARLTEAETEVSETEASRLNEALQRLSEHVKEAPKVRFRYFTPDDRKQSGAYETVEGQVRRISLEERKMYLVDRRVFLLDRIHALECLI